MKPFRQLTRRARLYRLRQLALSALETYGLAGAHLSFIQYFENIIYRVDVTGKTTLKHASSPYLDNRYVLRIHAMSDRDAIASELTWLKALSQEAGLSVPMPVKTLKGKLLATIVTPDMPNGRVVSLMHWLDGRKYQKGLQPEHIRALGQAMAELHNFSSGWQPPAGFSRPHWDWEAQLGGSMFRYSMDELINSMPARFQQPFMEISQTGKQLMEKLGKSPRAYGMIHADLYPENVLFKAGKAYPIDFEDCGYGYWMWDIAVALCEWAWSEKWERMRDAFFDGYGRNRTLPRDQLQQLDLFVALQYATMVLWASAFLKNDPQRIDEYEPWREKNGNKLLAFYDR
jgi:Ser/Thr protein kinase RdoA (MazF antagonist)